MARLLGQGEFGRFAEAAALVGLFRVLPDLGMAYASSLQIARDRSQAGRLLGSLLGLQASLSLVTLVACLSTALWLYEGRMRWVVGLLCADLLLKSLKSTLRFLLKAFESFGTEALSLVFERCGLLIAVLLAITPGGFGLLGAAWAIALVRLVDTAGLFAYVEARILPLRPGIDVKLWRELAWKGLPFAYAGAMVTLFFQVDQVMIGQMRGAEESGFYRAPVLVLEGLTLVPRVLGFAFIPAMAAWHVSSPTSVTSLYRRGVKYLLLVGLPIAVFGALAHVPFVRLLFGPAYDPSAAAARILIPTCVLMFLSNLAETTLACIDRWRAIVISSTLALALNVALNLFWIPQHGYVGAAWATLLTEGAYFATATWALQRAGHSVPWPSTLWRPVLAALAFGAVLFALLPAGFWTAAVAASLCWIVATFALGVWDRSERQALLGLLRPAARG